MLKTPFPKAAITNNPKTFEDCFNIVAYLVVNNIMSYKFDVLQKVTEVQKIGGIEDQLYKATNRYFYPELFLGGYIGGMYIDSWSNDFGGTTISIDMKDVRSVGFDDGATKTLEEMSQMNAAYFSKTQAAVQSLIDDGKLTAPMSQLEKAKAIANWISLNIDYENNQGNEIEHFGYSAIVYGKTVCSGYTALYNLMCRYVGITDI